MNEISPISEKAMRRRAWGWLVLSVLVFGALMAFRDELHPIWLRVLVAAVAFGILGLAIQKFRRRP